MVRLSILGVMALVATLAVGLAAVRANDENWSAIVFALTVSTLGTASLIAIYRRGAWAGFAVFGWAQFLVCQPHQAPSVGLASVPATVVCRLIPYVDKVRQAKPPSFQIAGYPMIASDGSGKPFLGYVDGSSSMGFRYFIPVHGLRALLSLSCLVFGLLGAGIGQVIDRRFSPP